TIFSRRWRHSSNFAKDELLHLFYCTCWLRKSSKFDVRSVKIRHDETRERLLNRENDYEKCHNDLALSTFSDALLLSFSLNGKGSCNSRARFLVDQMDTSRILRQSRTRRRDSTSPAFVVSDQIRSGEIHFGDERPLHKTREEAVRRTRRVR